MMTRKRIGIVRLMALLLIAPLCACSHINCKTKSDFAEKERKEKNIFIVTYKDKPDDKEPSYQVNVRKMSKGFGIFSPIYKNDTETLKTNFAVIRNKDSGNFSGLQLSYNF